MWKQRKTRIAAFFVVQSWKDDDEAPKPQASLQVSQQFFLFWPTVDASELLRSPVEVG